MARGISSYTGAARTPPGAPGAEPAGPVRRHQSYERVLDEQGVEQDPATGIPFRWVDEASTDGRSRKRKHYVAMSAEEAQTNSKPGQCWDFYVVGARCAHGCERLMSGWTHRGRKFVNEHHHVTDIPRDEMWEEDGTEAADRAAVGA